MIKRSASVARHSPKWPMYAFVAGWTGPGIIWNDKSEDVKRTAPLLSDLI